MFLIRILIIVLIVSYLIWFVNNRILGKNIALTHVITTTLLITGLLYLFLGGLSYLLE